MTRRSRYQRHAQRPAPSDDTARQIARVNELSQSARTTWFALLGYLAFVGVTLLGVEDADFFIDSRQTDLPLVGVAIPTSSFFKFAPILGAALYIYLHLHLRKLWEALHAPPPTPSGRPLDEQIYPWLVNDLVLRMRNDGSVRPRPLDRIAGFVTRLLVWVAGPFVLLAFWWRSMPAHEEWMTLLIALTLLLSLYAGFASWWHLRACRLPEDKRHPVWSGRFKRPIGILVVVLIVAVSWLRTEAGFDHYAMKAIDLYEDVMTGGNDLPRFTGRTFPNGDYMDPQYAREIDVRELVWTLEDLTLELDNPRPLLDFTIRIFAALEGRFTFPEFQTHSTLARTDLRGVEIVSGTADLAARDVARRRFRAEWCRRQGLEPNVCGNLYTVAERAPNFIEPNRHAWCHDNYFPAAPLPANAANKSALLTAKATADCDEHFAKFDKDFREEWSQERESSLAQLERRDLRGRDLRGADMALANLTDADLREGRLEGAYLVAARLERANLNAARLEGANLTAARLKGAYLVEARLEGAILRNARLEGANLVEARLEGADLSRARLEGAILWDARLEGAELYAVGVNGETKFTSAIVQYAAMKSSDISKSNLNQDQVNSMFGDRSVTLPPGIDYPAHWPESDLFADAANKTLEFYDRWRAWQAENGYTPPFRN